MSYDLDDYERALDGRPHRPRDRGPATRPAGTLEAAIRFSLHDFTGAFTAADALLREDPSQIAALATRFDAALELGRIDEARADLEHPAPRPAGRRS